MTWVHYEPEELAWIEARRDWPRRRLHSAFVFQWNRPDVSVVHLSALCKRRGWLTGRTGRFGAERPPPTHPRGKCAPGSEKGWFRRGHRPHTARHVGYEFIDKGYVRMIVAETNPHTGAATRPVMKHRWLWEQANGPVPAGYVLKCLDGDRANTDPANWVAIPRALLARLAGRSGRDYDAAPAEVKPVILATARLEQAIATRRSKT